MPARPLPPNHAIPPHLGPLPPQTARTKSGSTSKHQNHPQLLRLPRHQPPALRTVFIQQRRQRKRRNRAFPELRHLRVPRHRLVWHPHQHRQARILWSRLARLFSRLGKITCRHNRWLYHQEDITKVRLHNRHAIMEHGSMTWRGEKGSIAGVSLGRAKVTMNEMTIRANTSYLGAPMREMILHELR